MPTPRGRSTLGIAAPRPQARETHRHAFVAHALRHSFPVTMDTIVSGDPPVDLPPPAHRDLPAPDPAYLHSDRPSPESRERRVPGMCPGTNQFPEHAAEGAPRHRRTDPATVRLSEIKRLHVGEHTGRLTRGDRRRAHQLKEGFKVFFDFRPMPFSPARFEEALRTCLRSWLSDKTKRDVQRSVDDSPPEWSDRFTRLFLKSQVVKKLPAQYGPAKAGQIVATFPKYRIFEDAVWAAYVEGCLERARRPSTYLHCRPLVHMRDWYRRHWAPGSPCTASDYTAWDSGCDHVFADFDCWLLRSCGLPDEYLHAYWDRKLHTRSYLGPLLPMQHSGDRWTWLFNTCRNAALTGASFDCPVGTPAAFSGDDMILCGDFRFRRGFQPRAWPMTPKLERGDQLDFCGFVFGTASPHVDSHVLLNRAIIAIQSGRNDAGFWDSFDLACRYGSDAHNPGVLAAAIGLSLSARRIYSLRPSRFPPLADAPPPA